jgi:hypothetical protein
MPLIIAEFGNPSSLGIAHYASNGIHHGGSDYQKQAKDNLRMLDNITIPVRGAAYSLHG